MSQPMMISMLIKVVNQATAPIRAITSNFRELKLGIDKAKGAFEFASRAKQGAEAVQRFADKSKALIAGPIQIAEDFEAAMAAVGAKLELSNDQLGPLIEKAKELGASSMRFSAMDAAHGMEFLAQAGFDTRQILAALPSVMSLATADGMELGRAAEITGNVLHNFKLDVSETARVADVLAKAAIESNANVSDLGETMSYSGNAARRLHVTLEETAAMAGLLANVGVKGSRGGTGLNAIMTRLAAPHREALKAFRAVGVNPVDVKTGNLKSVVDLLGQLDTKMAKLGTAKKSRILHAIFGQEAMNDAGELMDAMGSGALNEFLAKMKNAAGTAPRVEQQMAANTKGAAKQLEGSLETLAIELGSMLLPKLKELRLWLGGIVDGITKWTKAHATLSKVVLYTVAAVAVLSSVLAGLMVTLATLASALGVMSIAMGGSKTGAQILGGSMRWLGTGIRAATLATWRFIAGLGRMALGLLTETVPAIWTTTMTLVRFGMSVLWSATVAVASLIASIPRLAVSLVTRLIPALIGGLVAVIRFGLSLVWTSVVAVVRLVAAIPGLVISLLTELIPAAASATVGIIAFGLSLIWSAAVAAVRFIASIPRMIVVLVTELIPAAASATAGMLAFGAALVWDAAVAVAGFVAALPGMIVVLVTELIPAFLAAIPVLIAFGAAILATPVGWIIAAVAVLAGSALLLMKYWEPVKAFFADLWDGVAASFGYGIGDATGGIQELTGGAHRFGDVSLPEPVVSLPEQNMSLPQADVATPPASSAATPPGLEGMPPELAAAYDQLPPEVRQAFSSPTPSLKQAMSLPPELQAAFGNQASPMSFAPPMAMPTGMSAGRVEGEIHLFIDSEGRAQVKRVKSNGIKISVDTGHSMAGAQ